jgi:hypothetical protein
MQSAILLNYLTMRMLNFRQLVLQLNIFPAF